MRKSKILAVVAGLFATATAMAQTLVTDAATELTDGTVISLQCRDTNGGAGWYFNGAAQKSSTFGRSNLYRVVGSAVDGLKLCRLADTKYLTRSGDAIGMSENADDAVTMTAVSYGSDENPGFTFANDAMNTQMEGTEKGLFVRFINNNSFLNMQGSGATPKFAAGTGGYSAWYVYKYTQDEVDGIMNSGTIVTELSELKNTKVYWLKSGRGDGIYLLYAMDGVYDLRSNYSGNSGLSDWTRNDHNCWKFAIYKSPNSEDYYIYNLDAQRFIGYSEVNNGTVPLVAEATNHIQIRKSSTVADHPFMLSCGRQGAINAAGVGGRGIVNWAGGRNQYGDAGNAFQIIEAGDLSEDVQNAIAEKVSAAENAAAPSLDVRLNAKVNNAYLCNMPESSNINCLRAYGDVANSHSGKAVLKIEKVDNLIYKIKYQQNQLNETYSNLVFSTNSGNAQEGVQVLTDGNRQYADNNLWCVVSTGTENTFKVRPYPNGSHWNLWGGGAPAQIGLWGAEGAANNVVFEAADLTADAAAAAWPGYRENYINSVSWTNTRENTIGYASAASLPEAKKAAETANSLYECAKLLLEKNNILLPDPAKYYTIRNAYEETEYLCEKYDLLQDGNYTLFCSTQEANTVPSLWQFERMTASGKTHMVQIKGANSGLYVSKSSWNYTMRMLPANSNDKGEFDFAPKEWIGEKEGSVNLWDPTHDGTATVQGDGTVKTWKAAGSENAFYIEEVSEIPVTVGPSGYATLNLPFAVEIPSGVKAYTAVENEDVLQLAEITGGVIPARTPVILTANPETYRFAIAYGNADAALTTALSGTLVPEVIADNATAYILKSKSGEAGVAMYLVNSADDRTLPANKAYLGSTSEPVNVKRLVIGGSTTGIAGLETAGAGKADIYSLDGRRVTRASKGLYIVGGKKIFMK